MSAIAIAQQTQLDVIILASYALTEAACAEIEKVVLEMTQLLFATLCIVPVNVPRQLRHVSIPGRPVKGVNVNVEMEKVAKIAQHPHIALLVMIHVCALQVLKHAIILVSYVLKENVCVVLKKAVTEV